METICKPYHYVEYWKKEGCTWEVDQSRGLTEPISPTIYLTDIEYEYVVDNMSGGAVDLVPGESTL